ncbi:MAG: hypothetical protein WB630_19025, partial [Candidatus Acidiferrales bacterium]
TKWREFSGKVKESSPLTAIAIGYPGDPYLLPDDLRERELAPRNGKPLDSFAFTGRWESPRRFLSRNADSRLHEESSHDPSRGSGRRPGLICTAYED